MDDRERLFGYYASCVDHYLTVGMSDRQGYPLYEKTRRLSDEEHQFMRAVEECADIPEQGADDFRRMVFAFFGHLNYNGKKITWDCNPTLAHAIQLYLKQGQPIPKWEGITGKYRSIDDDWQAEETG